MRTWLLAQSDKSMKPRTAGKLQRWEFSSSQGGPLWSALEYKIAATVLKVQAALERGDDFPCVPTIKRSLW